MISTKTVGSPIQSLVFGRYRGFRDGQDVELRRLNLVYGQNNAGKSAILRLPAVLAASRTPGGVGLQLSEAVRGAGFKEVQWRGPLDADEDPDLWLGVTLAGGATWSWTFQWNDAAATSVIQRFRLTHGHQQLDLEQPALASFAFDGIIPGSGANAFSDAHRGELARALGSVIWLGAKRVAPTREGTARGAPGGLSNKGEGAAALVAADARLRGAVSRWFESCVGCTVDIEALGSDRQRLVLQPAGAVFAVPFPDAGEGLQQVFPVVVALEVLRDRGGLLCIEEPESNLHPRMQRELADLIVSVLTAQEDASVLLETHSEVFLLAALKAGADGLRDAIRLHWVETGEDGVASIELIALDETARPTTPRLEQAFDTMGVMRRELIQARKSQPNGG